MKSKPHPKVLCLGLDGGDLEFIRKNRKALPNLRAALKSGRLFEPQPPRALSGSVWPTFYNGCDPGEHGVYQHLVWDPQRMGIRRIGPDWCHYEPFWKKLEAGGRKVAVFDVPYSFPGSLQSGVEITDWGTHGQTWPMACSDRSVSRWLGKSVIGRETPVKKTGKQLKAIQNCLVRSASSKGERIIRLLSEQMPDVLIAVFGETHRGGHTLFSLDDRQETGQVETALLDVYRAVDSAIGKILQTAGWNDASVLIFSVHGMALEQAQGHLVRPLMQRINEVFAAQHLAGPQSGFGKKGFIRYLRSKVPDRLQHAVGAASPDRVRQWVVEQEIAGGLDWTRTFGLALRTDIRTEIRLNLVGREAQGLLEPGSDLLERYVDLVRETFTGLTDVEHGHHLVEDVVEIQEMYPGPQAWLLPDLVITWRRKPLASRVFAPRIGTVSCKPSGVRGGDHTDRGFAILNPAQSCDDSLPTLEHVRNFAAFIEQLAFPDRPPREII